MNNILTRILFVVNEYIVDQKILLEQRELDLSTVGMDSLLFIHIIVALEEEFEIEIPDEYLVLDKMNTIAKIANIIDDILSKTNSMCQSQGFYQQLHKDWDDVNVHYVCGYVQL